MLCAQCRNPANALSGYLWSDQGIKGSHPYLKDCLCILYGKKYAVALMTKAHHLLPPDTWTVNPTNLSFFSKRKIAGADGTHIAKQPVILSS